MAAAAGSAVVAAVGIALLVKGLYPADLPKRESPGFVDNIFANRAVLLAARMLLVSAAGVLALGGVFIAVSIGHRMDNREWLRRAGPFEISEGKVGEAEDDTEYWRRVALKSQEDASLLRQQLERSEEIVSDLRRL